MTALATVREAARGPGVLRHLARTALQVVPVLLIVATLVFLLVHATGSPLALLLPEEATTEERDELVRRLGLDRPLRVQYAIYMGNLVQGDLGYSYRYGSAALPVVLEKLPATLELTAAAMLLALLVAVPAGIVSARSRNGVLDLLTSGTSVLGRAMPSFWIGIMAILLFSVHLGVLPVSGTGTPAHLVLPAGTLAVGIAAELTRMIRSAMLEVLGQDHVRTARAKGAGELRVTLHHVLRNAMIPLSTVSGLQVVGLLGGALVTETVFAWPGMGQLVVQAVGAHDMALVQASVLVVAVVTLVVNTSTDAVYRVLDPRVRLA